MMKKLLEINLPTRASVFFKVGFGAKHLLCLCQVGNKETFIEHKVVLVV